MLWCAGSPYYVPMFLTVSITISFVKPGAPGYIRIAILT